MIRQRQNTQITSLQERKCCESNCPRKETVSYWAEQSRLPGHTIELSPAGWVGLDWRSTESRARATCHYLPTKKQREGLGYRCMFNNIRCRNLGRWWAKTLTFTFLVSLLGEAYSEESEKGNMGRKYRGFWSLRVLEFESLWGSWVLMKFFITGPWNRMVSILKPAKRWSGVHPSGVSETNRLASTFLVARRVKFRVGWKVSLFLPGQLRTTTKS